MRSSKLTLLILGAILLGSISFTGCGTTPAAKIAQGERVLITVVNDGMTEWAAYVNAGKATVSQVATVHKSYAAYLTAQLAAKAALEKLIIAEQSGGTVDPIDAQTAQQSFDNAEASLLALINSYIK